MAIYRRILIHPRGGGGIKQERFFFGGTASPFVAAAATCIGVSQPPEQLNVELSGVIQLVASPSVLTSETSSVNEVSAPPGKVDEELTAE
ncbi:hypothetical protein ES703_55970 [subsurface metagenome]